VDSVTTETPVAKVQDGAVKKEENAVPTAKPDTVAEAVAEIMVTATTPKPKKNKKKPVNSDSGKNEAGSVENPALQAKTDTTDTVSSLIRDAVEDAIPQIDTVKPASTIIPLPKEK
jgi:hypothetical protein